MVVNAGTNVLTWEVIVVALVLFAGLAGLAMLILRPRESESAERVGVRAQLIVDAADIAYDPSAGGFRPAVGISNIGYLPAKRIVLEASGQFSATRELATSQGSPEQQGLEVIGPGQTRAWVSPHVAGGDPSDWLFVYGRVRYADGLGARRTTEFCFRYVAGRKPLGPANILPGKTATQLRLDGAAS